MQGAEPVSSSTETSTGSAAKSPSTPVQKESAPRIRRFGYTQKPGLPEASTASGKDDALGKTLPTISASVETGSTRNGDVKRNDSSSISGKPSTPKPTDPVSNGSTEPIKEHVKATASSPATKSSSPNQTEIADKVNGDVKVSANKKPSENRQANPKPLIKTKSEAAELKGSRPLDSPTARRKTEVKSAKSPDSPSTKRRSERHKSSADKPKPSSDKTRSDRHRSTSVKQDDKPPSDPTSPPKSAANSTPTTAPSKPTSATTPVPNSGPTSVPNSGPTTTSKPASTTSSVPKSTDPFTSISAHNSIPESAPLSIPKSGPTSAATSAAKYAIKSVPISRKVSSPAMKLIDTLKKEKADRPENSVTSKESSTTNSASSLEKIPRVVVKPVPNKDNGDQQAPPLVMNKVIGASIKQQKITPQPSDPKPSSSRNNVVPPESTDQDLPDKRIDVCRLLSIKTFSNSVDLQINDVKYACSGAILAYHSPVFESQLSKDVSIIVLEDLYCPKGEESIVEECLLLLYGGGVILTNRNIDIMIRFAVVYQIENLYRLSLEWVRNCISVQNVYKLWRLGTEQIIAAKNKRKRNDLVHICKNFIIGKEVEIAFELKKYKNDGIVIEEEFVLLMLQFTNCATIITDLL